MDPTGIGLEMEKKQRKNSTRGAGTVIFYDGRGNSKLKKSLNYHQKKFFSRYIITNVFYLPINKMF
jgi:hypothetical protein